ncbi:hypothetical protein [Paenibacillus soyae]|uniref:Uncharacterized protein n=1 Tax=Paenibacillus soyae TaxID=2969249 RepID=A0A9X2S877_9BACL|nr:hypothetical protein [Paenibacillus soyae]MCR2804064.1 hypothetical protein [Paenibacillus soyae]
MTTETVNQKTTKNLLQFCYTCAEAHTCDTEKKCIACWEANGLLNHQEEDKEGRELTTEELLVLYAL